MAVLDPESSMICTQLNNTQCRNTNGSYECPCVGGYEQLSFDGDCERKGVLFAKFCKFKSIYCNNFYI